MTDKLDILIPVRSSTSYPTMDLFWQCVRHVQEHTSNFRLIVVDDASEWSDSEGMAWGLSSIPDCLYVRNQKQKWFTRTVNIGLRLVNTEWAVVLNSDAFVQKGWLEELFSVKEYVESLGIDYKVGLVGSVYSPNDSRRFILTSPPQYVTGHCWALRMEAMHQAADRRGTPGRFLDEIHPQCIHIFSDNEICARLNEIGWKTVVSHYSHVDHTAGSSWGHLLGTIPTRLEEVNDQY